MAMGGMAGAAPAARQLLGATTATALERPAGFWGGGGGSGDGERDDDEAADDDDDAEE